MLSVRCWEGGNGFVLYNNWHFCRGILSVWSMRGSFRFGHLWDVIYCSWKLRYGYPTELSGAGNALTWNAVIMVPWRKQFFECSGLWSNTKGCSFIPQGRGDIKQGHLQGSPNQLCYLLIYFINRTSLLPTRNYKGDTFSHVDNYFLSYREQVVILVSVAISYSF